MHRSIFLLCAVGALGGCGQSGGNDASQTAVNAGTTATAPTEKRSPYCFFKNEETKGWKAAVGKDAKVTVTGKAHVKDSRYKPELGQPEVTGTSAEVRPTISVNTGYASPDNWWDVSFAIPDSTAVDHVNVRCGSKTLAELAVKR
jgi:hypothetical protein